MGTVRCLPRHMPKGAVVIEVTEPNLCNFVTAARVVQQTQADFDAACGAGDTDAIHTAYQIRESALALLTRTSPFDLVREPSIVGGGLHVVANGV